MHFTHGEDQSVSEAEQSHLVNRDCVFAGRGLQIRASEPALKTVKSQGLIRGSAVGCPGCSIPGLRRMRYSFFDSLLHPQTAVSVQGRVPATRQPGQRGPGQQTSRMNGAALREVG